MTGWHGENSEVLPAVSVAVPVMNVPAGADGGSVAVKPALPAPFAHIGIR
jgi:hypothetical protein